ncbi:MAG TPA: vWA domain-containing protein [Candidatus Angelobacter sp.]|nr:vWA domain-containing protein [Candidatus Angelobacter sp.]
MGTGVEALQSSLFQARMGDLSIPIIGVQKVEHRRVLVLVDQSGSMARRNSIGSHQKEALDITEDTLNELLQDLPIGVSVAYGFFNDKAVFTEGFFSDSRQLQQAIADAKQRLKKPESGGTAMFDAIHQAILQFETPQPGDALLLLSDGGENKSKLTEGKFEKEFRRSGLRLELLLVNQHSPEFAEPYVSMFIGLAHETGGSVGIIDINDMSWAIRKDAGANREALRKFWTQEVLGGYLMRVQPPRTLTKPRKWIVRISADSNPELKHVTLQYPAKLAPCTLSWAAAH